MTLTRSLSRTILWLEWPMILFGLLWLALFVVELTWGLSKPLLFVLNVIWAIFIFEFLIRLAVAPRKKSYLQQHWLTALALFLPVLRVFRAAAALRVLRLVRILGTASRGLGTVEKFVEAQRKAVVIHMGLIPMVSKATPVSDMTAFCTDLAEDLRTQLEKATGADWRIRIEGIVALDSSGIRRPSEFLDEATTRMSEQAFDIVLMVTDAPLSSRRNRMVAGLPSTIAQIAVMSTHNLLMAPRGAPTRSLDNSIVKWNAAGLGLHLVGHILGLSHSRESKLMKPFSFDSTLEGVVQYNERECNQLAQIIRGVPEYEVEVGNPLLTLALHLTMAIRHSGKIAQAVWRSGAFLLSLRLPGLVIAAVAPSFVLVFTAEIWDVGFGMSTAKVVQFSLLSMGSAALYLVASKDLFFPTRAKRLVTEHIAVLNVSIFLTVLAAVIGVYIMLGGLMMVIEVYFFPEDLMATWPTLDRPSVDWVDKLRLAAFISGIGVTTGALAGGMESRTLIHQLAVFELEP